LTRRLHVGNLSATGNETHGGGVKNAQRLGAEVFGTFWLVLGGCGTAVLATSGGLSVGVLGVAFAFGLTVLTMAYAVGHISGGHFNPAVTIGLWAGKRFDQRDVVPYIVAQVVGAILAAAVLFVIASGLDGFDASTGAAGSFATNGFGDFSPAGYSLLACLVCEVVMTAFFLIVIMGATDARAPKGAAPVAIGLALTLIHLISIPVTNTSVNPARSIGPALFAGGDAISQLWLFIVAPIAGAAIGALVYRQLLAGEPAAEAAA
jgi:aquaporin Z